MNVNNTEISLIDAEISSFKMNHNYSSLYLLSTLFVVIIHTYKKKIIKLLNLQLQLTFLNEKKKTSKESNKTDNKQIKPHKLICENKMKEKKIKLSKLKPKYH